MCPGCTSTACDITNTASWMESALSTKTLTCHLSQLDKCYEQGTDTMIKKQALILKLKRAIELKKLHHRWIMNSTVTSDGVYTFGVILSTTLWLVTSVLVLVLNAACFMILGRVNDFSDTTKVFLRSMTINDLCLGIFVHVPTIGLSIQGGEWPFGDYCYFMGWITIVSNIMSYVSVLLVTIDRYIAVVRLLRYEILLSSHRAVKIVCFSWLSVNLITFVAFIQSNWTITYNRDTRTCIFYYSSNILLSSVLSITAALCLVNIAMYCHILKIARWHRIRIRALETNDNAVPVRPSRKSFNTALLVNGSFIICLTPGSIIAYMNALMAIQVPQAVLVTAQIMYGTQSWLNVFIYYIRNKAFKETANKLFFRATGPWGRCLYKHDCSKGLGTTSILWAIAYIYINANNGYRRLFHYIIVLNKMGK